ncbi:lysoplasmalogenase [Nocardia spumae]|uniref:lysoplasmalogenase n=1 Tax=Nocardia spumae TaxID=2887190 RepID=UPI001D13B3FF|nr:lysoplasmalogenase [Nocardia spumae]
MPRPFRAGFVAAAAVTVAGAATGRDRWQWAAKPLMMPLLAADVLHSGGALPDTERRVLLGSLAAATVGDVLLIDPDDDRRLVAGASAFAIMQTGYSALWWRRGGRPRAAVVAPRVLAWLGAGALLRARAPKIAAPLTAYGATLGAAAALASDPALAPGAKTVAGTVVPNRDPRSRLALGALLFTLSDGSIVLRRLFARTPRSRRAAEAFILATYAGAQYLLTAPTHFD